MINLVEAANARDNHRVWHTKVSERNGVYVWVGNLSDKLDIDRKASKLWYENLDKSEVADSLVNARSYFTRTPANPDIKKPIHSSDICGSEWLGIARAPLPKDWYLPNSRWPGWEHIMHWRFEFGYDHRDDYKIPPPSTVFEYVRSTIKEYPSDLTQYSRDLVEVFNLSSVAPRRLIRHFPWLNTRLAKT